MALNGGWRHPFRFLHAFVYVRWPLSYISVLRWGLDQAEKRSPPDSLSPLACPPKLQRRREGEGRERGRRFSFDRTYHSKVLRTEEARKIVSLDRPVRVENPERVVPFPQVNRIVLDVPGRFAVISCPCRDSRGEAGCRPRDVCLVVGSPFVDFMVDHGSAGAREVTQREALRILEESAGRGHVHTAWFKDVMGGRFYAICNCCHCCCMGMKAMRATSFRSRYLIPSGFAPTVDAGLCEQCGLCGAACPFGAMVGIAGETPRAREGRCFGCGVCRTKCPRGAISLALAPARGEPLDVALMP